jgi:hypothetical protein
VSQIEKRVPLVISNYLLDESGCEKVFAFASRYYEFIRKTNTLKPTNK